MQVAVQAARTGHHRFAEERLPATSVAWAATTRCSARHYSLGRRFEVTIAAHAHGGGDIESTEPSSLPLNISAMAKEREALAGELRLGLLRFLADAKAKKVFAADLELTDNELIDALTALGDRAYVVLGNGAGIRVLPAIGSSSRSSDSALRGIFQPSSRATD